MSLQEITDAGLIPLIGSHLVPHDQLAGMVRSRDRKRLLGDIHIGTQEIWIPDEAQEHQANIKKAIRDLARLEQTSRGSLEGLRDRTGINKIIEERKKMLKLYLKEGPVDYGRLGDRRARIERGYIRPADEPARWQTVHETVGHRTGGLRDIKDYER